MKKFSGKILIVVGTYSEEGGKSSFFGEQIGTVFTEYFGVEHVTCINGGTYRMLEERINEVNKYRIILWMADVDNRYKKLVPEIKKNNTTCFLIQSKRVIEKGYHLFDIVSRLLTVHSNLGMVITREEGKYYFTVIDPLGNIWIETHDIKEAAKKIVCISDTICSLNRVGAVNIGEKDEFQLEERFITVVKEYGEKFSQLIRAIHPERFLGNASTRCMHGFPSIRCGDFYFISQRNVDKTIIDSSQFVKMERSENSVRFYGNKKPSVDAPVQIRLYNFYKHINYIIHGHVFVKGAPTTQRHIPCGFIEEFDEITMLFPHKNASNFAVNLLGHGCIILAKDLEYFQDIQLISREFPDRSCQFHT
jgi:hypothetical protein